jgi:hypothetical protein
MPQLRTAVPPPAHLVDAALAAIEAELDDRPAHCVASTGVFGDRTLACDHHVDGAHRCSRVPQHAHGCETVRPVRLDQTDHLCDCGFVWVSVRGGADALQQEWERIRRAEAHAVLWRLLAELRAGGQRSPLLQRLVCDVADEMKISLVGPDA